MELAFAMCADAATVADGKLYVHGGGWSDLVVGSFPTTYPAFSVVFALELDGSEPEGRLPLELTLRTQDSPVAAVRGWIDVPARHRPGIVTNQATFSAVPLPVAGPYLVQLSCDGRELGGVTLEVRGREQTGDDERIRREVAASVSRRRAGS